MKTFPEGACPGPDPPLVCKHLPLPTSLPDILKPIGHRGYNKYSKGSKNVLPAMNERYKFWQGWTLALKIMNILALNVLKISGSF